MCNRNDKNHQMLLPLHLFSYFSFSFSLSCFSPSISLSLSLGLFHNLVWTEMCVMEMASYQIPLHLFHTLYLPCSLHLFLILSLSLLLYWIALCCVVLHYFIALYYIDTMSNNLIGRAGAKQTKIVHKLSEDKNYWWIFCEDVNALLENSNFVLSKVVKSKIQNM